MRDSVNDLYDSACELLDAAQRLRRAAARRGSMEALAPSMGCLEAALRELAATQAELDKQAAQARPKSVDGAEAVRRALADVAQALGAAERVCGTARATAAGQPPGFAVARRPR